MEEISTISQYKGAPTGNPELLFPNRIYGREQEQEILHETVEKAISGENLLVRFEGPAGIGKSYFARSFFKKYKDFQFYTGKYEQFKQGVPYLGLRQICEGLVNFQFTLSGSNQTEWKNDFLEKFESQLTEIHRFIPSLLETIQVNPQLGNETVSPVSLRNKFNRTVLNFIAFLVEKVEHNVVLHIDDLQWADKDSLEIIRLLIEKRLNGLLVVISNRPSDHFNGLSIDSTIEEIKVVLTGLPKKEVSALLKELFKNSNSDFERLEDILYSKCEGNPYILNEYLRKLSRVNEIVYSDKTNSWSWGDFENIDVSIEDVMPRMLRNKLEQMSEKDRLNIQIGACFGSEFNVPFIAQIIGESKEDLQNSYRVAVNNGFLLPMQLEDSKDLSDLTNYKFKHDLVQETVHDSMSEKLRSKLHYKIADYYLSNSALGLNYKYVFDCAYHLNECITDDSPFELKIQHAEVNLQAVQKAKLSASFDLALGYLHQALDSNMHHNWSTAYHLAATIRIEGYQIARLCNVESLANKLYAQGLARCNKADQIKLRLAKIMLDTQFGELSAALSNGILALQQLGINVSDKANKLTVVKELARTKLMLGNKSFDDIYNLPKMSDPEAEITCSVILWMFRSAYYLNPELNGVLALKLMQITLRKGINPESYSGFMAYGIITGAGIGNFKTAYEYSEIGGRLADKYNVQSARYFFGKAIYLAYKMPLRSTLEYYQLATENGYEQGDFLGASEPTVNESLTLLLVGKNLHDVYNQAMQNAVWCEDLKMIDYRDFQVMFMYHIKRLQGNEVEDTVKNEVESILEKTEYKFTLSVNLVLDLQRTCLESRWEDAMEKLTDVDNIVQSLTGLYIQTEYYFYKGLTLIKNQKSNINRSGGINRIIKKFVKWSDYCPENYLHKLYILQGLNAYRKNDAEAAIDFLKKAIADANEQEFYQNAAIANWFLADLYEDRKDEVKAQAYRDAGSKLFKNWGTGLII